MFRRSSRIVIDEERSTSIVPLQHTLSKDCWCQPVVESHDGKVRE